MPKACVIRDNTTNRWTLKGLDGKRKRLRPILETDPDTVPADVIRLAIETGNYLPKPGSEPELPPKPIPAPAPTPAPVFATTDLEGYVAHFLESYSVGHMESSLVRVKCVIAWFQKFVKVYNATSVKPITDIRDVTSATINAFFLWRLKQVNAKGKGIRPYVAVNDLKLLSGLFSLAIEEDLIDANPTKKPLMRLGKQHKAPEKTRYLTPAETTKFLEHVAVEEQSGKLSPDAADAIRLMLYTGMRISAAVHMRFDWIDGNGSIRVPPTTNEVRTKTKTGYTAEQSPQAKELLDRRRERLGEDGRVFPTIANIGRVQYRVRQISDKLNYGEDRIHSHRLRHTTATTLVSAKVPLAVIGSQLGQRSIQSTQRYAKVTTDTQQEAVSNLKF